MRCVQENGQPPEYVVGDEEDSSCADISDDELESETDDDADENCEEEDEIHGAGSEHTFQISYDEDIVHHQFEEYLSGSWRHT